LISGAAPGIGATRGASVRRGGGERRGGDALADEAQSVVDVLDRGAGAHGAWTQRIPVNQRVVHHSIARRAVRAVRGPHFAVPRSSVTTAGRRDEQAAGPAGALPPAALGGLGALVGVPLVAADLVDRALAEADDVERVKAGLGAGDVVADAFS
jgi:hypothetical protein